MLSSTTIKYLRSLQQKKFRQKYDNFIVEGDKIAREILLTASYDIEGIYAVEDWIKTNREALKLHLKKTLTISQAQLERISGLRSPNQVLLVLRQAHHQLSQLSLHQNYALYLDNIRDPGNMGTIWRIADWFGFSAILQSPDCVEPYNPKVIQASMGAFLRVPCLQVAFETVKIQFPNLPICGTVLDGDNLFERKGPDEGLLVIGNESQGISAAISAQLDFRLSIPAVGGAESLNAAVATGIACAVLQNQSFLAHSFSK
ncbi:MAG: RNA methyltransferase [Bacteroidota bacterium]